MPRYYHLDSDGEDTNLQLYSLRQATSYWECLREDVAAGDQVADFHERCVFVICTIGLSVSQLLGQNNPSPSHRVPPPTSIFETLVRTHSLDPTLSAKFSEFIGTYDQCRHFGLTHDGTRHFEVSQLTYAKAQQQYEFGLLVWKTIVGLYRKDPQNELDELNIDDLQHEP